MSEPAKKSLQEAVDMAKRQNIPPEVTNVVLELICDAILEFGSTVGTSVSEAEDIPQFTGFSRFMLYGMVYLMLAEPMREKWAALWEAKLDAVVKENTN